MPNDREQHIRTAGRTAIARRGLSAPTRHLLGKGLIKGRVLHHGRGKAQTDSDEMAKIASHYAEFDPNYAPDTSVLQDQYDTVVSNFVLNTLPPNIREEVWNDIEKATHGTGTALISVRSTGDTSIRGEPYEDGVITSIGTFQKPYSLDDIIGEAGEHFEEVELVGKSGNSFTIAARGPKHAMAETGGRLFLEDLVEPRSNEEIVNEVKRLAGLA